MVTSYIIVILQFYKLLFQLSNFVSVVFICLILYLKKIILLKNYILYYFVLLKSVFVLNKYLIKNIQFCVVNAISQNHLLDRNTHVMSGSWTKICTSCNLKANLILHFVL